MGAVEHALTGGHTQMLSGIYASITRLHEKATLARVVEARGGKIWGESERHDEAACPGSRFHVRLPLK